MPYKPPMPDEEIEVLAVQLSPLWRKGKPVWPWLRKHDYRLIALNQDEWTWASLEDALARAGITYQTGCPWAGEHLRAQVTKAMAPLKGRNHTVSEPNSPTQASKPPAAGAVPTTTPAQPPANHATPIALAPVLPSLPLCSSPRRCRHGLLPSVLRRPM